MKIVIIEDEPLSGQLLERLLVEHIPNAQIVASLQSVEESIEWFNNHTHPNLLFLDVQLSDGNAFDFLKVVSPECSVIFTTSSEEYALLAYGTFTIDYLLKPVSLINLQRAIYKYREFQNIWRRDLSKYPNEISAFADMNYRKRLLINKGRFIYMLSVADIAIIFIENKITYAVDFSEKKHPIEMSLDEIYNELNPVQFYRANRQTIINIDAIARIEHWFNNRLLIFTKSPYNKKIIISREKKRYFLECWLNN